MFQGLSLPWLVRRLGLARVETGFCEEGKRDVLLLRAAIDFLAERRNSARNGSDGHLYEDLMHQYEHKITEIDECGPDGRVAEEDGDRPTMGQIMLDTIRRERDELNLLRATGRIGDSVHRTLERELDLSESRLN